MARSPVVDDESELSDGFSLLQALQRWENEGGAGGGACRRVGGLGNGVVAQARRERGAPAVGCSRQFAYEVFNGAGRGARGYPGELMS